MTACHDTVLDHPVKGLFRQGDAVSVREKAGGVGQLLGFQGDGAGGNRALSAGERETGRQVTAGVEDDSGGVRENLNRPPAGRILKKAGGGKLFVRGDACGGSPCRMGACPAGLFEVRAGFVKSPDRFQ